MTHTATACTGGLWASGLIDVTSDLGVLDTSGRWAIVIPYSGTPTCARFEHWTTEPWVARAGPWHGPTADAWSTSLDESAYVAAVESTRAAIADGSVYQANICRIMSARLPEAGSCDVSGLHELLTSGNPAPYSGFLRLPEHGVHVVSASPELFLSIAGGDSRRVATSGPIKGTGATAADLSDKDVAENIMIVDLVRNDLSRISVPGTVKVPELLQLQQHPGLVHLVSYVTGELVSEVSWDAIVSAMFPPGSVTGAPKTSALRIIEELETEQRSYYCGAFGWVDADTGEAELAVAIRTFWLDGQELKFGTGAGITWGSEAHAEWRETELKAARLIGLAGGSWPPGPAMEG
jgi:para-aminobenzoate synthetase component 1